MGVLRDRLLQQRDQRQQDDDWARVSYQPLEMPAIGFVWIHARGRIRFQLSLARDDGRASRAFPAKNESPKGHQGWRCSRANFHRVVEVARKIESAPSG